MRANNNKDKLPKMSYSNSPFLPNNLELYQHWRDKKLAEHPKSVSDLLVELKDPKNISANERAALLTLIQKSNMALYVGNTGSDPSAEIPMSVANTFGLGQLNKNWLADDNGLTSLKVADDGIRKHYIPYTDKPIHWHTDGYYNAPEKQIHALNLHVVQKAATGGENQLMDHEIAYLLLREKNPDFIPALMSDDAMTIPEGTKADGSIRPDRPGPVFSITEQGHLHMRYTARSRNIKWSEDPLVVEAVSYLQQCLNDENSPYVFKGLLEPGMGLISNNVLHDRSAFTDDDKHKRHYYRARYFDRIND